MPASATPPGSVPLTAATLPAPPANPTLARTIELLETLNDARETWRESEGGAGQLDSRILLANELWHSTCPRRNNQILCLTGDLSHCRSVYAELERTLREMRRLGRQQAVDGVGLHRLYWHVCEWWIRCEVVIDRVPVMVKAKGGKQVRLKDSEGRVVYRLSRRVVRHRDVRRDLAEVGAGWIAARMRVSAEQRAA